MKDRLSYALVRFIATRWSLLVQAKRMGPMCPRHTVRAMSAITLACCSGVVLSACSAAATSPSASATRASNDTRSIAIGQATAVAMASTPSTGFSWSLDEVRSSGLSCVAITDKGFTRTNSGLVGAPGRRWWSVSGVQRGTATLTFVYQQAWDRTTPASKVRTLHIDVQ
jgi:predicted secreted protein